jgi:DNA replication protein DnaC
MCNQKHDKECVRSAESDILLKTGIVTQQMLDYMELIEDRHGRHSTIFISQVPVADWYDLMEVDSTAADAILDRIVHTAVRFELKGDSLRKK